MRYLLLSLFFLLSPLLLIPQPASAEDGLYAAMEDSSETKKTKVPKEDSDTRATQSGSSTSDDDSGGGFISDCLMSIMDSLCTGLFASCTSTSEESSGDGTAFQAGATSVEVLDPYSAVIDPENPYMSDVDIWESPGGHEVNSDILGTLPRGMEVLVTATCWQDNTLWVFVAPLETPAEVGWIQEQHLQGEPLASPPAGAPEPVVASVPVEEQKSLYSVSRIRWELLADFSYSIFGDSDINGEYKNNLFGVGIEGRWFFGPALHLDLAIGYTNATGTPQYDYVIGDVTEIPSDSKLEILDFTLRLGQMYRLGNPSYFFWGIGPSVVNISEEAAIVVVQGGRMIDQRIDELSEWTVGGQVRLEGGLHTGKGFLLGIHAMYSIASWESNEEKSLTFDFLQKGKVDAFSFGLTFAYGFF